MGITQTRRIRTAVPEAMSMRAKEKTEGTKTKRKM